MIHTKPSAVMSIRMQLLGLTCDACTTTSDDVLTHVELPVMNVCDTHVTISTREPIPPAPSTQWRYSINIVSLYPFSIFFCSNERLVCQVRKKKVCFI